jgi:hypothetical protein
MTTVYDIISEIKTFLRNHPIVNTVTFGDISEINLNKTEMFPLAHFFLGNTTVTNNSLRLRMTLLFADIVDYSKGHNATDEGDRQDDTNLIDVYNTQMQTANALISHLKRGDLYRDKFQVTNNPILEPFKDRFENELAGWTVDVEIEMPNNYSVC